MSRAHRIILNLIQGSLVVIAVILFIYHLLNPEFEKMNGIMASFALPFLPNLIQKIFKTKMSFRLQLTYYIFLFFSLFLGIDLDFYKTVPHFDKFVHFASGTLSVVIAWYVMKYFKVDHTSKYFQVLFIICFCIMIGVLWEFFEFGCDKLLGQNMQQLIQSGVDDTMYDLLFATIGASIGATVIILCPKEVSSFFTKDSNKK